MPIELVTVNQPKHPLHALTTYELAGYRRDLEKARVLRQARLRPAGAS